MSPWRCEATGRSRPRPPRAVSCTPSRDSARGARTVSAHDVVDGPFIETKEWLVGFYLIDCADEAEAITRARCLCPTEDHVIEVRPVGWRWKP
jgi:hypothetical protein